MFGKEPLGLMFRLRFAAEGEQGGSGQPVGKKPTSEMTSEERIEFEQAAKRSAQDKLKAFDGVTPADVQKLRDQIAAAEAEKLTEQERAVSAARAEARTEAQTAAAAQTVDAVLKVALKGRSADAAALLDLDKSAFVADGAPDIDAITKWVDDNSAITGSRKHVDLGQGAREPLQTSDRATGEAEAQKRFGKNN